MRKDMQETIGILIVLLVFLILACSIIAYIAYSAIRKLNSGDFGDTCRILCEEEGLALSGQNPKYCWCEDRAVERIIDIEGDNYTTYKRYAFRRPII